MLVGLYLSENINVVAMKLIINISDVFNQMYLKYNFTQNYILTYFLEA